MNIFHKRPLCLILCIGLCGFFLFSLEITALRIALPIFAILLGIISIIIKNPSYNRMMLIVISVIIIISCLLSYLYFDQYFKAYKIYEGEIEIVGTVEVVSQSSSYTTRLLVDAEKINGEDVIGYNFCS